MRSWISLLRTSRAPFAVLVLCAVGLVLPSQTHDMLTALTEGSAWRMLPFHVALIFLGFSAWYWARAALSARWQVRDTQAARQAAAERLNLPPEGLDWLPRILFGVAGLIGIALLMMAWSWFNSLIAAGWVVLGRVVMRWRTGDRPGGGAAAAARSRRIRAPSRPASQGTRSSLRRPRRNGGVGCLGGSANRYGAPSSECANYSSGRRSGTKSVRPLWSQRSYRS